MPSRVALLTPPGAAAIAVVRLSGPLITQFAARHLSRPPRDGRCVHCTLADGDRVIDDPVVVLDASATALDISLHGGEWVVRSCIELATRLGFQSADAQADEAQHTLEREMLAALPLARTEAAIRLLLDQPRLWRAFAGGSDALQQILDDRSLWWMLHPPRVAIVGAPNAGKSTLANRLFGQERSITADVPGTTRDWVGDFANLDGLAVLLLDTPGQRLSTDPIEQAAIARSRREIDSADLLLLILDPTAPIEPQRTLLNQYPSAIHVINKSDLAADFPLSSSAVRISALTGAGVDGLQHRIVARFAPDTVRTGRPQWWTARQEAILRRAVDDPTVLLEICR